MLSFLNLKSYTGAAQFILNLSSLQYHHVQYTCSRELFELSYIQRTVRSSFAWRHMKVRHCGLGNGTEDSVFWGVFFCYRALKRSLF